MPSVRPDNLPAHEVIKRRRVICKRVSVGKAARKSRAVELIAELLKDRDPPDANELRCFDLIRRFHRWGWRDTLHKLRLVTVPVVDREGKPCLAADSQPLTRRYVWELANFQQAAGPEWNLVTWAIDEEAVWFQRFQSERDATAFFQQDPMLVRDIRA